MTSGLPSVPGQGPRRAWQGQAHTKPVPPGKSHSFVPSAHEMAVLTQCSCIKDEGSSPQAPEQPGKLQKTGVGGETELAFRQGQLAVLERVVGHGDAQGPAGEDRPGQPPSGLQGDYPRRGAAGQQHHAEVPSPGPSCSRLSSDGGDPRDSDACRLTRPTSCSGTRGCSALERPVPRTHAFLTRDRPPHDPGCLPCKWRFCLGFHVLQPQ